jgi:hypothetical protein
MAMVLSECNSNVIVNCKDSLLSCNVRHIVAQYAVSAVTNVENEPTASANTPLPHPNQNFFLWKYPTLYFKTGQ